MYGVIISIGKAECFFEHILGLLHFSVVKSVEGSMASLTETYVSKILNKKCSISRFFPSIS